MPGLPRRLSWIAERVSAAMVADIGTDHGLLAVELARRGHQVVATDVSEAALSRARHLVHDEGLGERVELRCGNGFEVFRPGEVEEAVIAGIGGKRIAGILELAEGVGRALLQPNRGDADLRHWLANNGWKITDEAVFEDGAWHFLMVIEKGTPASAWCEEDVTLGPVLRRERPASWQRWLKHEQDRYGRLQHRLEKQGAADAEQARVNAMLDLFQRTLASCQKLTALPDPGSAQG